MRISQIAEVALAAGILVSRRGIRPPSRPKSAFEHAIACSIAYKSTLGNVLECVFEHVDEATDWLLLPQ
jgi:hypothetical protein